MYNTILNDIAKSNREEKLQVVKYDCKNSYFIATDRHILICEKNNRFKSDKDLFFSPITSKTIKYDCCYPDFSILISKGAQNIDNFTNGAIYKRTSKNRHIARELIRFGDITFDLKYITQIYSCLGVGGDWTMHYNAYCYTTPKGFAFLMPIGANEKHLNENYMFIKVVDVCDLEKNQKIQTCFVLLDDNRSVLKCFKNIKKAQEYMCELSMTKTNVEHHIEEIELI